jgi:hypothetical protein
MGLKEKLIKEAFGKLQSSIEKFKGFLKKPAVLLALKLAAFILLNKILDELKKQIGKNITDDEALNYVKNHRDLQKLLGEIGNDIDESDLNEIVLACENSDFYAQEFDNFLKSLGDKDLFAEDYINLFNNSDEFDNKVSNSSKVYQAAYRIAGIAPWLFLTYVIVLKIKDFLNQNETPSPHRGKYLQRLIRSVSSILSQERLETNKRKEIQALIGSFKIMDAVISGVLLASLIYVTNRKKLQSTALNSFQEITLSQICEPTPNPSDIEIIPQLFAEQIISCPVDIDDNLVPHFPMEEKNISCEIVQNQDTSIIEGSQPDIATKALFQNNSSTNLNILVKAGDTLSVNVPMATYDGNKIYSSVNGIVELVEPNKIYVQNISDPNQTYLEETINKLNEAYKEQNDTKFFMSEFYLPTIYPVMLKYSPLIDGSLSIKESLSLIYKIGGVKQRWDGIITTFSKQKKSWEKRNKDIAGSDKVKAKAEAEQMGDIKIELDQSEQILFKYLKSDGQNGINQAKITKPDEKEFELIEFYFSLAAQLSSYFDKNNITTAFINKIDEFLRNRFFTDKYSVKKIKDKINAYCKELSEGTFFSIDPNFYDVLRQKWDEANAKVGTRFTAGENYLLDLQKNNKKKIDNEKITIRNYILFLFNFSIEIDKLVETKYSPNKTKWVETELEGNQIEQFFTGLWKRYNALPEEIEVLLKNLDSISSTFATYSIAVINGEQYRLYSIADQSCQPPDEDDPYLSPNTKKKYGDLSYWMRYCAFATLASVANPATSWSTGLPPPIGPTPFPIVYIPIRAFETNWGFIVVGLTITGIYPFPWALFVNWSTEHHVPLADPATLLKKEIEALKKALTDQLSQFKKDRLKTYLDKAKADIKEIENRIINLQNQKRDLQTKKPKRDRSVDTKEDIPRYMSALYLWTTDMTSLSEQILIDKKDKVQFEIKYKIIKDAYAGSSIAQNPDPKIQALQKTQDQIDKQFAKLDTLLANMDKFLAPLPIATKPETANFAFTLKNPKPIIKMAADIDQNVNYGPLNAIIDKFELKNEDLMKSNYGPALSKSFNNFKAYKAALKAAMPTIIQSDPFPKWENLKPSNLPWMTFLLKEWAPTGKTCYGFPGFP